MVRDVAESLIPSRMSRGRQGRRWACMGRHSIAWLCCVCAVMGIASMHRSLWHISHDAYRPCKQADNQLSSRVELLLQLNLAERRRQIDLCW
jgi:hypothetical protein